MEFQDEFNCYDILCCTHGTRNNRASRSQQYSTSASNDNFQKYERRNRILPILMLVKV